MIEVPFDEAIARLKEFVAERYDGSIEANHYLDALLWEVRLAHPYNHNQPRMRPTEPGGPLDTDEVVINLEELGL